MNSLRSQIDKGKATKLLHTVRSFGYKIAKSSATLKLPIRFRLSLTYCAGFCVWIGALEAAAYFSVREAIHSIVDHELEIRLAGLEDHVSRHVQRLGWPQLSASLREHPAFQPDFPVTTTVPFPNLSQDIDVRGEDGVSNFHALLGILEINNLHGLLITANYMFSHAINDGSARGRVGRLPRERVLPFVRKRQQRLRCPQRIHG